MFAAEAAMAPAAAALAVLMTDAAPAIAPDEE
jgi:hypothetical protein